jgi:hypothetical protein
VLINEIAAFGGVLGMRTPGAFVGTPAGPRPGLDAREWRVVRLRDVAVLGCAERFGDAAALRTIPSAIAGLGAAHLPMAPACLAGVSLAGVSAAKTAPRKAAFGLTTVRNQTTYNNMTPVITDGGDTLGPHRRRAPV